MKNLNSLKPGRLLGLLFIFFCLCSLHIIEAHAANFIDVQPIHSTSCDNGTQQCCYDIHITLDGSTDGLADFKPFSPSCWNWTCFNLQSIVIHNDNSGATGTLAAVTAGGIQIGFSISFSTAPDAGATVDLLLCPKDPLPPSCPGIVGQAFSWHTSNGGTLNGSGSGTFNACGDFIADCLGCDQTIIYRPDDCHQNVCYKRRATVGGVMHTIRFHFDPALCSCTPECYPTYLTSDPTLSTSCYSMSTHHNGSGCIDYIDVSSSTCSTAICDEICLSIPTCGTRHNIKVKAVDLSDSLNCNAGSVGTFKIGTVEIGSKSKLQGENNYPNPVTSATNFKTVVPFTISASSEARIMFVDQSGKIVYKESQSFEGAGKHFFYITANDLPSGAYYYTIESPLGVMIVKRNLLIVK